MEIAQFYLRSFCAGLNRRTIFPVIIVTIDTGMRL